MTPNTKTKRPKAPAVKQPRAARPPKAPKAPTREELLAAIGKQLDLVEERMREWVEKPQLSVSWHSGYYGRFGAINAEYLPLKDRLDELLRKQAKDDDGPGADEAIYEHFRTPPGEALRWSRPGSCLAWIGDIPVRMVWGGFALPTSSLVTALDPRKWFMRAEGAVELGIGNVNPDELTPEAVLRKRLKYMLTPQQHYGRGERTPVLRPMSREGIEKVTKFRADPASAWWVSAAAGVPVDALPMPDKLPAVQTSLLG